MKRRWKRAGAAGKRVVTVSWGWEGVAIGCWAEGGVLGGGGLEELGAGGCTAAGYVEAVGRHAQGRGRRGLRVIWILQEAVERAASGDGTGALPGWLEACWRDLVLAEYPDEVLSGMGCLEEGLGRWEAFGEPGTGVYLDLPGEGVLLAAHPEGMFRRSSRRPSACGTMAGEPGVEWLQQTRMLYRTRTGAELRRILLPACRVGSGRAHEAAGLELCGGLQPPGWSSAPGMTPGCGALPFLHASALRCAGRAPMRLRPEILYKRVRRWRREAALRLGACLLLGGWILSITGACAGPGADPRLQEEWKREAALLQQRHADWKRQAARRAENGRPFHIVGTALRSLPAGLELDRVSVRKNGDPRTGLYQVVLEGRYDGHEDAEPFRSWIAGLRENGPVRRMQGLRLERSEGMLLFRVEGGEEN